MGVIGIRGTGLLGFAHQICKLALQKEVRLGGSVMRVIRYSIRGKRIMKKIMVDFPLSLSLSLSLSCIILPPVKSTSAIFIKYYHLFPILHRFTHHSPYFRIALPHIRPLLLHHNTPLLTPYHCIVASFPLFDHPLSLNLASFDHRWPPTLALFYPTISSYS